jgi:hypothetical protein
MLLDLIVKSHYLLLVNSPWCGVWEGQESLEAGMIHLRVYEGLGMTVP